MASELEFFLGVSWVVYLNCFTYKSETDTLTFSCFQLAKHIKKKLLANSMVDDRKKKDGKPRGVSSMF